MTLTGVIRPATRDDLAALRARYLEFHAFHVHGVPDRLRVPDAAKIERAGFDRELEEMIDSAERALLVAEKDGPVIGVAEVQLEAPADSPWVVPHRAAKLLSLMVAGGHRRRGVGKAPLRAAERWAADGGATELRLNTWEFHDGPLPFYEARGYRTLRRELTKPLG